MLSQPAIGLLMSTDPKKTNAQLMGLSLTDNRSSADYDESKVN
jgi:hypothetical protein